MDPPFVAAVCAGVGCVAVGGKIAGNQIRLAALSVCKGDVETIVQERVGLGCFAGPGTIEC